MPFSSLSELMKTFIDNKTELEELALMAQDKHFEIYPSVFGKFVEEKG